jgi:integrase
LAERKEIGMHLPEGVEVSVKKKKNGKTYVYYYWNPGRGTKREVERIKLPDPEKQPRLFWAEVERRQTETPTTYPARSIGDLLARYRKSDEFTKNAEGTKRNYEVHMRRFEDPDTWGMVPVNDLTPLAVQTARDAMKETPVMANQMLAVGRTIWDWAIPLDLAKLNPFEKIKDIDVPDRGHVPWPSWVIDYVREHAWPDLVRMERLGIMTCQRGSDMVEMGPEHRDGHGIWSRPKKTRKRRRAFLIPLNTADALELDRWAETPVTFTNSRWKQPIARHRADLYLYSPKGAQYTPDGLRARYGRWLEDTEEGRQLCKRWKEWVTGQVKKYFWDIDPEDADHPSIHGLRGTGILARAEAGYDVDQIANDIGMSRQNVEHCMRFRDQMKVATDGQRRLKLVSRRTRP